MQTALIRTCSVSHTRWTVPGNVKKQSICESSQKLHKWYTSDNMLRTVFMPQCPAVNLVYHLSDVYVG